MTATFLTAFISNGKAFVQQTSLPEIFISFPVQSNNPVGSTIAGEASSSMILASTELGFGVGGLGGGVKGVGLGFGVRGLGLRV